MLNYVSIAMEGERCQTFFIKQINESLVKDREIAFFILFVYIQRHEQEDV